MAIKTSSVVFPLFALIVLSDLARCQPPAGSPKPPAAKESIDLDIPRSSDPGRQPFLPNFIHDEWRMWSSPFRGSSYPSHTAVKYAIPFVAISAGLIASDRKAAEILPNTRDQAIWSGRISQIGASYTLAGASGTVYLLGKALGDKHAREAGWLALEGIAHTQLIVFGVKQLTNRERPLEHEGRGGFWHGGDSFPSGHAATSFAVATVFAYEYRDHIAVPITAYALAGLVSASRLSAQRHWVSDIFVGGASGFLIGRYIYKHHHDPDLPGSPVGPSFTSRLTPDIGFSSSGPVLSWHF